MPKTKRSGDPIPSELPSTLRKSSREAQETFAKAHDSAAQEYGEGERAHRVAYSALKHKFEKRGDRWVPKQSKGPSDPRAANPRSREGQGKSFGGVDYYGSTKQDLLRRARELDVQGRSKMSKAELAEAISRKQS
ncbi:MAG: ChaB family protein [Nocardiopsaceae bacterium]|nr:ChaB family protein [Nocardiopsaceae bacterium]